MTDYNVQFVDSSYYAINQTSHDLLLSAIAGGSKSITLEGTTLVIDNIICISERSA